MANLKIRRDGSARWENGFNRVELTVEQVGSIIGQMANSPATDDNDTRVRGQFFIHLNKVVTAQLQAAVK